MLYMVYFFSCNLGKPMIKENSNLKYTALFGGNFEGKGFLNEALHNDEKENYVNVRYVKRNNFESFEM